MKRNDDHNYNFDVEPGGDDDDGGDDEDEDDEDEDDDDEIIDEDLKDDDEDGGGGGGGGGERTQLKTPGPHELNLQVSHVLKHFALCSGC
eukprot:768676-Hanusia_phi.AAC.3